MHLSLVENFEQIEYYRSVGRNPISGFSAVVGLRVGGAAASPKSLESLKSTEKFFIEHQLHLNKFSF